MSCARSPVAVVAFLLPGGTRTEGRRPASSPSCARGVVCTTARRTRKGRPRASRTGCATAAPRAWNERRPICGREALSLYVHGAGHFHPETEITNRFLGELGIGTDDEWIVERVGIRSRRTVLPLEYIRETRNHDPRAAFEAARYTSADLASRAARLAIERAGIAPAQIGLVLGGGSIPDTVSPADACNVARALGLEVPRVRRELRLHELLAQLRVLVVGATRRAPRLRAARRSRSRARRRSTTPIAPPRCSGATRLPRSSCRRAFRRVPGSSLQYHSF